MEIKNPLLMQGFTLSKVAPLTTGPRETFNLEQFRGKIVGVDFLPDGQFTDDFSNQSINLSIGGQQIDRNGSLLNYAGFFLNPNSRQDLPIRVNANGGQTLSAQLTNGNAAVTIGGQVVVFYENPYDSGPLDFAFEMGSRLTLKRQTFRFTIGANSQQTPNEGQFTIAKGYGNCIGISVKPEETNLATSNVRLSFFDLFLTGAEYYKNVELYWFLNQVNRPFGIFPVNLPPTSTNRLSVNNLLNGDAVTVIVTCYFAG